ncbi:MAG: NRDE family protein [Chitinophagales bacterium]|nr:NRDE family protein [Chitinophagales bacterium]
MCTVTYLPVGKDAFIFTSNRDESKIRPTKIPVLENFGSYQLLFPKDAIAGGTWICLSNLNRIACLMNGAFERHEWKPPYRISRGLVLLDLFKQNSVNDFLENYNLNGVEPFTMIIIDSGQMIELRWDSVKKHIKPLETDKPKIWSSTSLYPKLIREKRELWFKKWLDGRTRFEQKNILDFHLHGGEGDSENDLTMNRYNMVQTVSMTSIVKNVQGASMYYHDLIAERVTETTIEFDCERISDAH